MPALRFDFNKAVDEALRHHPHLAKNTVFIEAVSNTWRGADIGENEKNSLESALEKARREDISFTCISHVFTLQAMIYKPRENRAVLFEDVETDRRAIFDHELAHLAIDGANRQVRFYPLDENICDAYAILRHLQRNSGDATGTDFCGWKRALDTIDMKTATHLTSFTVDAILADAQKQDFSKLTPDQTAQLALDYARRYTPDEETTRSILNSFAPLWGKLRTITPDNLQPIRELARRTLQLPPESPAFYVGQRVLAGFLKSTKIVLEGQEWDDIRQKLRKKNKGPDRSDPLIKLG